MKLSHPSNQKSRPHRRTGAAAVEFALCFPLIAGIVFASIEMSNALLVKQALTSAAYDAGNVASAMSGTSSQAISRANMVLAGFRINSATVTISPNVDANTASGTEITITCSAPLSQNTTLGWSLQNKVLTRVYKVSRM